MRGLFLLDFGNDLNTLWVGFCLIQINFWSFLQFIFGRQAKKKTFAA